MDALFYGTCIAAGFAILCVVLWSAVVEIARLEAKLRDASSQLGSTEHAFEMLENKMHECISAYAKLEKKWKQTADIKDGIIEDLESTIDDLKEREAKMMKWLDAKPVA